MNKAIERIKGFCCEVNERQWEELVRVADEVGVEVWTDSRSEGPYGTEFAQLDRTDNDLCLFYGTKDNQLIPYPSFLAKLKGEEEWQPKAGDMVEVGGGYEREYIAKRGGKHFCWGLDGVSVSSWDSVRPLRPTITRAEAEQIIGKRIID